VVLLLIEMTMQLKKTQMCKFHLMGVCTRGSQCQFAHDALELQPLPDFSQTKLCRNLTKLGACNDPRCKFAHDVTELRQNSYFYKTKVCKYWLTGECHNHLTCRFAHSEKELRKASACDETGKSPASGCDETGSTTASSDGQKESMEYTCEEESCDKASYQPEIVSTQYNDMDGFSVDSEPSIAELVSEWCLQGDCGDSDSIGKLESTATSPESSRSFTESSTNLQEPLVSLFNNFPKPEKQGAVWNNNSTFFFNDFGEAPTARPEKDALWTNSMLQLNDAIAKALTKVGAKTNVHQPVDGWTDGGNDSSVLNHSKDDCMVFLPPGLDIVFGEPGNEQFA